MQADRFGSSANRRARHSRIHVSRRSSQARKIEQASQDGADCACATEIQTDPANIATNATSFTSSSPAGRVRGSATSALPVHELTEQPFFLSLVIRGGAAGEFAGARRLDGGSGLRGRGERSSQSCAAGNRANPGTEAEGLMSFHFGWKPGCCSWPIRSNKYMSAARPARSDRCASAN